MKLNFRAFTALGLAVIVAALTFHMLRPRTLIGTELKFSINTGNFEILNMTEEPLQARMISTRWAFTLAGGDLETNIQSTRLTTDGGYRFVYEGEIPPGNHTLQLTRGRELDITLNASAPVTASVNPYTEADTQHLLRGAAFIIVLLLSYFTFESRAIWLPLLKRDTSSPTKFTKRVIE